MGIQHVEGIVHAHPSGLPAVDRERTKQQAEVVGSFLARGSAGKDRLDISTIGLGSLDPLVELTASSAERQNNRLVLEFLWNHEEGVDPAMILTLVKSVEGAWNGTVETMTTEVLLTVGKAPEEQFLAAISDGLSAAARDTSSRLVSVEAADHPALRTVLQNSAVPSELIHWKSMAPVEEGVQKLLIRVQQAPRSVIP